MATFNKFNSFTTKLGEDINFTSDTIKVFLADVAPVATDETYTGISGTKEITAGNGYTAGGETTAIVSWNDSLSAGTAELVLTDITWTASGGSMASFQYAVCYDSTTDDLIGWHDYGSSVTLNTGESFDWDTAAAGTGFIQVGP